MTGHPVISPGRAAGTHPGHSPRQAVYEFVAVVRTPAAAAAYYFDAPLLADTVPLVILDGRALCPPDLVSNPPFAGEYTCTPSDAGVTITLAAIPKPGVLLQVRFWSTSTPA